MEWDRHADMMHLLDCLVQLSANRGLHPRHQDWSKRYMARKPQEFMPGDYVRDDEKRQSIPIDKQLAEYAKVYCRGNYNQ